MLFLKKRSYACYVIFSCILSIFYSFPLKASIHNFETTRLKSTAGAGVASFLMDEATILNPAPLAFFKYSSVYIQKTNLKTTPEDPNKNDRSPFEGGSYGFIVSDAKGSLKGSLSYVKQDEQDFARERWSASLASTIAKSTSLGFQLRRTTDETTLNGVNAKERYHQFVVGASHAILPEFSLGLVIIDPFKTKPEETRLILGAQYIIKDMITLMLDGGADYNKDMNDTFLYRMAFQLKLFSDVYLRTGTFRDKGLNERGNGIGLGWVTPKLSFEGALKSTRPINNSNQSDKIREYSLALSYRF